ncbi:MAG: L,D-transpeptidase [Aestuariivirga sp.]|uniref:L,D-transpeptidase n=1 Tax=Aestuariivirga sp. TaxID=2650926 RepID=UPI0038D02EB3
MVSRRHLLAGLAAILVPATAHASTPAKPAAKKKPPKPEPRLVITINKVSQKMTVTLDGDTVYKWPVSTGAPGYETPSGTFRPFRMEKEHYSNEWDDAPMPHSIFFTAGGHAVHGSYHVKSLGRRASHGCVRLHPDNAAKLFALVKKTGMSNTRVVVKGGVFADGGTAPRKTRKGDFFGLFD